MSGSPKFIWRIYLYFVPPVSPLTETIFLLAADEHPRSMMLPQPCFTEGLSVFSDDEVIDWNGFVFDGLKVQFSPQHILPHLVKKITEVFDFFSW